MAKMIIIEKTAATVVVIINIAKLIATIMIIAKL